MTVPLPAWVNDRADQAEAVQEITDHFAFSDVVMLIGPTGAGKTLVADLVRRRMGIARTAYLCVTNSLLAQVGRDFPYAATLMGRRNYPTELYPGRFSGEGLSCADCTAEGDGEDCEFCEDACPYEVAKARAFTAELLATNYAYFLTECNGPGRLTRHGGRPFDLVICDEGDRAADELARHTEIAISRRVKERLGLAEPRYKTVESSWPEWFDYAVRHIGARIPKRSADLREMRYRRTLVNLKRELGAARDEVANGEWLYKDYRQGGITFQPIHVRRHAPRLLWPHGTKWLFMSATLIPQLIVKELGWEGSYESVEMASTFPPERRPIYYKAVAPVTRRNAEESWPLIAGAVGDIIETYPGERVLVHTVSYSFATFLMGAVESRRLMMYTEASGRDRAIERFRATPGAVLLAPGLERGISFDYDQCRCVIICKVPFANKGDAWVAKRMNLAGGRFWYVGDAALKLVQSAGRGMRAVDDECHQWILDQQFLSLYRQEKRLFPGWFREAVRMNGSEVLRERRAALVS